MCALRFVRFAQQAAVSNVAAGVPYFLIFRCLLLPAENWTRHAPHNCGSISPRGTRLTRGQGGTRDPRLFQLANAYAHTLPVMSHTLSHTHTHISKCGRRVGDDHTRTTLYSTQTAAHTHRHLHTHAPSHTRTFTHSLSHTRNSRNSNQQITSNQPRREFPNPS